MNFLKSLVQKFTGKPVDWDELEESLIRADLGVPMTLRILKSLQKRAQRSTITATDIAEVAREEIGRILPIAPVPITPLPAKPKVLLIVGVNGTGKTTSTAKLAHFFKRNRHSVLLAAADTFRAAAIEQLGIWAERLGVEMIRGQYNADPAALCYEAYEAADRKKIEFLICDTAGRLHTKSNLMAELGKVLDDDAIIFNEGVTNAGAVLLQIPRSRPNTTMRSGGGGLGWSGGLALGAKLAAPDRMMVQISGDGGFYFGNPSSVFAVSQQYKLPIFSIVMDNTGWNAVKQSTLRVFPEGEAKTASEFESELAPKVAFSKVGEAFGAYGEEIGDPADVPAAIARCLKEVRGGRSALLHARVTKM